MPYGANTYHQMYIQAVFVVKYREAVIKKIWKEKLFAVIGNLINETECNTILVSGLLKHRFEWQKGFGAFSYSHSHIDRVFKYIKNQEAHHKKETFREEYEKMLKAFGVEYDAKYLFEDLI